VLGCALGTRYAHPPAVTGRGIRAHLTGHEVVASAHVQFGFPLLGDGKGIPGHHTYLQAMPLQDPIG
jgi:hypothetical protein